MGVARRRIRFFNTYEPVTNHYRDVVPRLCAQGWDVEIFCSRAPYRVDRGSLPDVLAGSGARVRFVPAPPLRSTAIRKIAASLFYVGGVVVLTLLGPGARLNVVLTQPPLLAAWFRVLRRLRGQRYVCHVMDVYPHALVAAGLLRADSPWARLARAVNAAALRGAERVIVIGRCMARVVENEGVDPGRVRVVPNWIDEQAVRPVPPEDNPQRKRFNPADAVLVGYSGNMGYSHHFDTLLGVAEKLADREALRFVLIGDGVRRRAVEEAVRSRGLTNVRLLPFQPSDALAESLSAIDIHVVTLRPEFAGIVVPSKVYGVFAAGRPVIYAGPPDSEVAATVRERSVGVVVAPDDPDALQEAIETLAGDPRMRQAMGDRARRIAEEDVSRERSVDKYIAALPLS